MTAPLPPPSWVHWVTIKLIYATVKERVDWYFYAVLLPRLYAALALAQYKHSVAIRRALDAKRAAKRWVFHKRTSCPHLKRRTRDEEKIVIFRAERIVAEPLKQVTVSLSTHSARTRAPGVVSM